MYRELTKDYFLKTCNLSEDYKVDAILTTGSGNKQKQLHVLDEVLSELNVTETKPIENAFFATVKTFEINGKRIWFDVVYGSAYLSEFLHAACMLGAEKSMFIGTCGGLQKGAQSADLVIPQYSFGDESSTRMYAKDILDSRHYPDKNLVEEVKKKVNSKYNIVEGAIFTCQAMLAETLEDIQRWSAEKYVGVEMETATFFAVCNFFKMPNAALLYITDNLIEGEIVGSQSHVDKASLRDEVRKHNYKVALEILSE
jgi:purine-nucleoside phosphorylase